MTLETVTPFVMLETARYLITGNVAVAVGARLSEYANDRNRDFFALTEAARAPLDLPDRGRQVDFLLVARHEVALIAPAWPVRPSPEGSDTPRVYDVVAE